MKTIALVILYFGKMPLFYQTWKITALHNKTIDFYLYTDDKTIQSEGNIHVTYISWEKMKKYIQEKYSFKLALEYTYKICDLKPAFGEIFYDVIKDYDFWGYCDIDLLFGDIRHFLTDEILETSERCFYNGHLSIYKNNSKMNALYRYSEKGGYPRVNYKQCFESPNSFYFDEYRGMYIKCIINDIPVFDELDIRRDPLEGKRKFYWRSGTEISQYVILWKNGRLYAVDNQCQEYELIYAHFYRRKFVIANLPQKVNSIVISPRSVQFNTSVTQEEFKAQEGKMYELKYKLSILWKSLKKYGIKHTLERQKWTKDYTNYITKIIEEKENSK